MGCPCGWGGWKQRPGALVTARLDARHHALPAEPCAHTPAFSWDAIPPCTPSPHPPQLGVSDVQISLTSLEEVFLTIARKAELEAAAAEASPAHSARPAAAAACSECPRWAAGGRPHAWPHRLPACAFDLRGS